MAKKQSKAGANIAGTKAGGMRTGSKVGVAPVTIIVVGAAPAPPPTAEAINPEAAAKATRKPGGFY